MTGSVGNAGERRRNFLKKVFRTPSKTFKMFISSISICNGPGELVLQNRKRARMILTLIIFSFGDKEGRTAGNNHPVFL